jgi:hypothetical protein
MSTASAPVVTRPTLAQLLGLAMPVVISRSAQVVVGVTDAVMVGALGESALAATTTAGMNRLCSEPVMSRSGYLAWRAAARFTNVAAEPDSGDDAAPSEQSAVESRDREPAT